jgi:HEAT repeat protein
MHSRERGLGFILADQYEVEIPDDQVGDNKNVKVGRDMLNDPDQRKRLSAIAGARNSKKRSKVPALLEILAWETDADILCDVIIALGKIGDSAAVPALIGKARHNDGWVRIAVARALGQVGDQRAVSTLTEMLTDRSKPVRLGKYGVPMETSECRISEEARDALALIKKR